MNIVVLILSSSSLQTMDQRVGLFILLAAGLLCLSLAPVSRAEDPVEDGLDDDMDVEDELDLGFGGAEEEEELEGDVQDEAPPTPKTPPTPKVRLQTADVRQKNSVEMFDKPSSEDPWKDCICHLRILEICNLILICILHSTYHLSISLNT